MNTVFTCTLICVLALAAGPVDTPTAIDSLRAGRDSGLNTNPDSPFWRSAPGVFAAVDSFGRPLAGSRTEVRSRWTFKSLYFLFICPYDQLNLRPNPSTVTETNELWKWDVTEVFIGSNFQNIRRYKEFEVSPQGEWIDLDIDLDTPHHEDGWTWNSGFKVAARIDRRAHIWYAWMRIPYSAIDSRPAAAGNILRVNFYRSQGPNHQSIVWRPTGKASFHVPESFGELRLR
ncbi:MAG: carbohydrate-binding family 9-like protein [Terracidiphilus sp.]